MSKQINIAVLPGDGIGEEVVSAALPVFEALGLPVNLSFGDIGWRCWQQEGETIPERTWRLIDKNDAVLVGATTSKPEKEAQFELPDNLKKDGSTRYISPIIQLRKNMQLFANVRPVFNLSYADRPFDCCIIRENLEGLYAGFDYYPAHQYIKSMINESPYWHDLPNDELSCSLRLQSKAGLLRLFRFAFEYADQENMLRVTLADKPNVLRHSSMLSRELFEMVAQDYPHIKADIKNVDAVAMWLVKRPDDFGVIVAENMFGDILSDVGAGIMGGLGFAPSANMGESKAYFEPVHGSAPQIGAGRANPSAMFLTIGLLLKQYNDDKSWQIIKSAVEAVVNDARFVTYDLGGSSSTQDMASAIIDQCVSPVCNKTISFLATGSEIVSGEVQDTTSHAFSNRVTQLGGKVSHKMQVSDQKHDISRSLSSLLTCSDAVVVTGGLGPTTDDNTRQAVSHATRKALQFSERAWEHIVSRLTQFKLNVSEANRQQALFPQDAKSYLNTKGTAFGFYQEWHNRHIFVLPGPPQECQTMFDRYVLPELERLGFFLQRCKPFKWLTIGLIEADISEKISNLINGFNVDASYRWCYPYLEVKIRSNNKASLPVKLIEEIDGLLASNTVSRRDDSAYDMLKVMLDQFVEMVYLTGSHRVADLPEIIKCENLTFSNVICDDQISFSVVVKPIDHVLELVICGKKNDLTFCQYRTEIPNRGQEVDAYIKHYVAWRLVEFIKERGSL